MEKLRSLKWIAPLSIVFLLAIGIVAYAETSTTTDSQTCSDGTTVPAGSACPSTFSSQETTCSSGGGKWCKNSDGATGWCSYSTSPCPAYDSASCAAQSGEWCAYQYGGGGWCATGGSSCPVNDEATCVSKGRNWCASTSSYGGGWCASTGMTCPANDSATCATQGGEWCTSSYGGSGWCSTTPGSCPVNDEATCVAKGRLWCTSTGSYSSSWCVTSGGTCPYTTNTSTSTPFATYTCSDGTKVSDSSMCPSNTTTYFWPNTESECKKYKGVWCASSGAYGGYANSYTNYSGSCMMAGSICQTPTPSNMMRCWDDTVVSSYSSCPSSPMTSSDCTAKGGNWCESSSSGSTWSGGWCNSKSSPCSKYPPMGKMTCPDNQTFASKISECPVADTTVVELKPTTKTCSDGTTIAIDAICPKAYTICSDGQKVPEGTECPKPKTEDGISTCLNKGGTWCVESGQSGYCSLNGCKAAATSTVEAEKEPELSEKEIKSIDQKKKSLIKKIDSLERYFKRQKDQEVLAQTRSLREKTEGLSKDSTAFDTLETIADDITTLQEVKNDLMADGGSESTSQRDSDMQKYALKQLKKEMKKFSPGLTSVQTRVSRLEKQGFTISSSLKESLTQGQTLIKSINNTSSYDEARDAGESLTDIADELNFWMPQLEQLTRLQKLMPTINKEIKKREGDLKKAQQTAKKAGIDISEYASSTSKSISDMKSAVAELKKKDFAEEKPFDFVQESIVDRLDAIDNDIDTIKSLATFKSSVKKIETQINKHETRIKNLAKKKKDTTETQKALDEAKEHLKSLKAVTSVKDNAQEVSDHMNDAMDLIDQLNELLKVNTPTSLEKELLRGLNSSEDLKEINSSEIEKQIARTFRIANLFRQSSLPNNSYLVLEKKSKNRNRLAKD